ncbi:hypothetical protein Tco_0014654 [Tanacetum coccineum]
MRFVKHVGVASWTILFTGAEEINGGHSKSDGKYLDDESDIESVTDSLASVAMELQLILLSAVGMVLYGYGDLIFEVRCMEDRLGSCVMVDGEWVDDPCRVKEEFRLHFANRFRAPDTNKFDLRDEIRHAVWGCGENKSPWNLTGSL